MAERGAPEYFTHYETQSAAVLFSDAYRGRVNQPSPLTRRIMSGIFVNTTRTVCERAMRIRVPIGRTSMPAPCNGSRPEVPRPLQQKRVVIRPLPGGLPMMPASMTVAPVLGPLSASLVWQARPAHRGG